MSLQRVHARKHLGLYMYPGPRSLSGGALLNIQRVRCRRKRSSRSLISSADELLVYTDTAILSQLIYPA